MVEDNPITSTDSPQLEYATLKNKDIQISKAAELSTNSRQQCVENVSLAINNNTVGNDNMFNI